MERDRLMSLLADRPHCCARLRESAEDFIHAVESDLYRAKAEVENLRHIIRTFGISPPEPAGDVESRCRNWRSIHLSKLGELFDDAANEIGRLKDKVAAFEDELE